MLAIAPASNSRAPAAAATGALAPAATAAHTSTVVTRLAAAGKRRKFAEPLPIGVGTSGSYR
ncbi:hypothetical protein GCM10027535_36450 [Mycolicibacterium hippocampi]|uniref:Uncharacterized protein n=1 Tax=Mycolicibacterium hippocampi TaxID=659824 RepID=A0A7I9ZI94_9MYCO|nr:hypothetical protein MHIP_12350 [Mycolicibacterium hippocampi]